MSQLLRKVDMKQPAWALDVTCSNLGRSGHTLFVPGSVPASGCVPNGKQFLPLGGSGILPLRASVASCDARETLRGRNCFPFGCRQSRSCPTQEQKMYSQIFRDLSKWRQVHMQASVNQPIKRPCLWRTRLCQPFLLTNNT